MLLPRESKKRPVSKLALVTLMLGVLCFSALTFAIDSSYKEERLSLKSGPYRIEAISRETLIDSARPNRYSVRNLFDNDETTAWVTRFNKGAPYREGGLLKIVFGTPVYANSISIKNGFQKTEKLYFANQRAKVLNIEKVIIGNQRLPYEYTVGLDDEVGEQEIALQDGWVQSINLFKTKEIIFNILEIYDGTEYKDLCISEMTVHYSDKMDYSPGISWRELKELITKNAIRRNKNWEWDELAKNDYKLFNDLLYYVLVGNKEAYALFDTYSPKESVLSTELRSILKKAVTESVR